MENTKAVTKVCAKCGNSFEHVQKGRGRPPKSCPTCRNAPKSQRRGRPPKAETTQVEDSQSENVTGEIEAGDTVVLPLEMFANREHAVKWATPMKVVDTDGEVAHVNYKGEILPQAVANLAKVKNG